jgi:hypothetical protein
MGDPQTTKGQILRGALVLGTSLTPLGFQGAFAMSLLIAAWDRKQLNALVDEVATKVAKQQTGTIINQTGTAVSLPIVYGRAKVGMQVVDVRQGAGQSATYGSSNTLALVGAIAVAPEGSAGVQGIEEVSIVYFNDTNAIEGPIFGTNDGSNNPTPFDHSKIKTPWNGDQTSSAGKTFGTHYWLDYFLHDGDDAQLVDHRLTSEFATPWPAGARARGVAYICLWMYYNEDVYVNGMPNVTMTLKGNKVADVTDLTAAYRYSENPADCIYDYMTSTRYGLGIPAASIDIASFSAAAAYCNAQVTITLSSGTVVLADRFTCNGFLDSAEAPLANLERLLSSCTGRIVYENGKFKLLIRQTKTAETFELNRTNIVGDFQIVKTGINQTPNSISSTFIDYDQNYQPQSVTYPEPGATNTYLTQDNDYRNEQRIELPFTEDYYMAQMIAHQALLEARADMGCSLVAQREALKLAVGDRVNVTHDTPGWTDQAMTVEAVGLRRDGLVDLLLREYDAAAYTPPTMTVKASLVAEGMPPRYPSADSATVAVLNISLNPVLQSGTTYHLEMSLSFSGGMGSYVVRHDPTPGTVYEYTTDYTGESTTVDLLENPASGTDPFEFNSASGSVSGLSTITITPYPEASAGGIAGTALTVTFQISEDE